MKIGDPVRADGRLAHVDALLVAVRFENGERRTFALEHVEPWPSSARAPAPEERHHDSEE